MAEKENENIQIVKPIENPRRDIEKEEEITEEKNIEKKIIVKEVDEQEEDFDFHNMVYVYEKEYEEEKSKKNKMLFWSIFGVVTVGVVGYFGSNYLQNVVQKSQNSEINRVTNKIEDKKDTTPYVEELAIKKDSQEIENKVIALLTAQEEEAKKEKRLEEEREKQEILRKEIEKKIVEKREKEKLEEERLKKEAEEEKKLKEERLKKEIEEQERLQKEIEKKILEDKKSTKDSLSKIEVVKKAPISNEEKRRLIKYEHIQPHIYTVKKGDTLVAIAEKFYGDSLEYKRIIRANRKLRRNSHVHFGEKIVIPRKDGKKRRRYILIEKGDTLALIAKEIYGSRDEIKRIVRANRNIRSRRSTLRVGQKVYIPRKFIKN